MRVGVYARSELGTEGEMNLEAEELGRGMGARGMELYGIHPCRGNDDHNMTSRILLLMMVSSTAAITTLNKAVSVAVVM